MVRKYSPGKLLDVKVTAMYNSAVTGFCFSLSWFFFNKKKKIHVKVKDHVVHSEIDTVKSASSQEQDEGI